jgi:two-component system sensor histidine kinase YesM
MMLKFCMQPLIENAIFHGRLEAKENPVISIQISRDDTQINIEIFNNGEGIELEKQLELQEYIWKSPPFQHEHMGLKNVHERLQTFYSKEYGLFIKPTDPALGFTIIMKIPFLTTG